MTDFDRQFEQQREAIESTPRDEPSPLHEDADEPCSVCGGDADDSRHGGTYHGSEVRDQHEYTR